MIESKKLGEECKKGNHGVKCTDIFCECNCHYGFIRAEDFKITRPEVPDGNPH